MTYLASCVESPPGNHLSKFAALFVFVCQFQSDISWSAERPKRRFPIFQAKFAFSAVDWCKLEWVDVVLPKFDKILKFCGVFVGEKWIWNFRTRAEQRKRVGLLRFWECVCVCVCFGGEKKKTSFVAGGVSVRKCWWTLERVADFLVKMAQSFVLWYFLKGNSLLIFKLMQKVHSLVKNW